MADKRVYDEASKASAEDGVVMVDGPDGVAVSLTADAADLTASRIADAAEEAHKQADAKPD